MDALTAYGTAALAVIAFVQFWVFFWFSRAQLRDAREGVQRSVDAQHEVANREIRIRLYLQMKDWWDSDRMMQSRRALAYAYLSSAKPPAPPLFEQMIENVHNFFEDLGSLLRRNVVDEDLTYDFLSYYVKGWFAVCAPYIEWLQAKKKDSSIFSDFQSLAERMIDIEIERRGMDRGELTLSPAEIDEFLNEEYHA